MDNIDIIKTMDNNFLLLKDLMRLIHFVLLTVDYSGRCSFLCFHEIICELTYAQLLICKLPRSVY